MELASGRQVALLAWLLIAGEEVSSRDRLIDALRRRLGAERIVREASGYRLGLEAGELDLARFEALVARAREEPADRAAATLREALALWRGPAYEDVRYEPFAQAEVARLEELRLAALEDRIEADLMLDRSSSTCTPG